MVWVLRWASAPSRCAGASAAGADTARAAGQGADAMGGPPSRSCARIVADRTLAAAAHEQDARAMLGRALVRAAGIGALRYRDETVGALRRLGERVGRCGCGGG